MSKARTKRHLWNYKKIKQTTTNTSELPPLFSQREKKQDILGEWGWSQCGLGSPHFVTVFWLVRLWDHDIKRIKVWEGCHSPACERNFEQDPCALGKLAAERLLFQVAGDGWSHYLPLGFWKHQFDSHIDSQCHLHANSRDLSPEGQIKGEF